MRTLAELLPGFRDDNAALILPGEKNLTISHSELTDNVKHLQAQLAKLGVGQDNTVALCLPNSVEFVVAFLAITWQTGTAAPLNPAFKQEEVEYYFEDLRPTLLVVPEGSCKQDSAPVRAGRKFNITVVECCAHGPFISLNVQETEETATVDSDSGSSIHAPCEEDIALVLHTSGTTGRPKTVSILWTFSSISLELTANEVPLTHRNLSASVDNICKTYALTATDRTILIMPLFHIHGIVASFLATLHAGSAIIIPPRLTPSFWKQFAEHKASWYTGTPTMHRIILSFPAPDQMPPIRFIRSCSSPLPPQVFESMEKKFGAPVLEAYAMTEAAHQITTNPLPPAPHFASSVGISQSGIEVCILDAQDKAVEDEEQGEICIRGPNVMVGYRSNDEANASAFTADGFFRTGDYGRKDHQGYLYLTGRIKEFINKGGEKISPVELDNVIASHTSVEEVVVFATNDDLYGQEVGAAVRLKEGEILGARELQKWLRQRVAQHKVPKKIWFPSDIPKTATGKVQRRLVAERMQEHTRA